MFKTGYGSSEQNMEYQFIYSDENFLNEEKSLNNNDLNTRKHIQPTKVNR